MKRIRNLLWVLLAAVLSAVLLTGCRVMSQTGTGQSEPTQADDENMREPTVQDDAAQDDAAQEPEPEAETWLQRYVAESSPVSEAKEAVLFQQECEGGFLAYINRKIREDIPAELREDPEFVNDGRYDVYESALFTVSKSGRRHKVRRYRTLPAPENTENLEKYFSEMRPRAFRIREDGCIVVLESSYEAWLADQSTQTRDRYYVRLLKENGVELSSSEIETSTGTGLECNSAVLLGSDLIAVPQGEEVLFFALDGKKRFSVSTPFPIRELCRTNAGNLAVVLKEDSRLWVSVINISSRTASVPQRVPDGAHGFCAGDSGDGLCFLRNSEIFDCDPVNGMSGKRVSLLSLGADPSAVSAFFVGADGSIHLLLHNLYEEGENVGDRYLIAMPCEIPTERLLLRIGFQAISDHLAGTIARFNRERRDVFLEAVDYRNLNTEIEGGELPELVVLDEALYGRLQAYGYLADLTNLIGTDGEYQKEDFFQSVWAALSDDGGALRRLSATFRIETMACDSNAVEGQTQMDLTALRDCLSKMPAQSSLYEPYYTSERLLEDLCAVNRKTLGTENEFDAAFYAELLNFSRLQPQNYSYDDYARDPTGMEKRIYDGRLLMLQAYISSLDELKWYDAFFENGACFVGWPTMTGSVSRLRFDEAVGISAFCTEEQRLAAAQFLRAVLSETAADDAYGFPVLREALESEMNEDAARVSYRVDEKGKFEIDKNGKKIEIARDSWYSPEWRKHFVYALTDVQRQKLLTLIENSV